MNKAALVQKIIAQLAEELEGYARSARSAHAEATDEQSKAENKYDTRGLEASYLARGQSRQAAETAEALEHFAALPLRDFGAEDPIDLGAVVELETKTGTVCYFIGPRAGGMEVRQGRREILVITPQSPLGRQLVGKSQGDRWETQLSRKTRCLSCGQRGLDRLPALKFAQQIPHGALAQLLGGPPIGLGLQILGTGTFRRGDDFLAAWAFGHAAACHAHGLWRVRSWPAPGASRNLADETKV